MEEYMFMFVSLFLCKVYICVNNVSTQEKSEL